MDPLFPVLPEDLSALSDEDLAALLQEHVVATDLIDANDEDFLKGMEADEVMAAYDEGIAQIELIVAEQKSRTDAIEAFNAEREEKKRRKLELLGKEEEEEKKEGEEEADESGEAEDEETVAEVVAEAEQATAEASEEPEEAPAEEPVPVTASGSERKEPPKQEAPKAQRLMRPPAAAVDRQLKEQERGALLVAAAGLQDLRAGQPLDRISLARAMGQEAERYAAAREGTIQKVLMARAKFDFPPERNLGRDLDENNERIRAVIPATTTWGDFGRNDKQALVASGGLCAPLTPIYTMPNFASTAEPVWDSLPVFQADRGGVNVPESTVIGDITSAISSISEAFDAAGGASATKSCQDMECPLYTEVAVQILSHCREFGNLNARAWPEKIAHENDLTMAALSRTSEGFMLDRIKSLSVSVTNGAETLGALIYLVDGIVKSVFGIRSRLRMDPEARFRVLLPDILPELLMLDTVQTQFDRFQSEDQLVAYLASYGLDAVFYLDSPSTGVSQIADASQTAGVLDGLPDKIQWGIYPEGAFIGVDSGVLELGIVRDSTLNATNDFQIFGERFRNLARLAPAQACYWVESDLCASGQYPPAGTARTCD